VTARIWDEFLTERDRAHLQMLPPRKGIGFGSSAAVLLIDNYLQVFGPAPQPILEAVADNPMAIGAQAWAASANIAELLVAARAARLPIIHVTATADSGLPSWNACIHAGERRGDLSLGRADDAARYEIVDACAPVEGEIVLHKSAPSAFWGTPLIAALVYLGVDTLIVGGESTSGCVRATVVDAAAHRYRVVVAEDCVYDRHEASHAVSLFDMHMKYADVLGLRDVLGWIAGLGQDRE
jgi:maleamate amidohydrolase